MANRPKVTRKLDSVIEEFEATYRNRTNSLLQWLSIPFLSFGLLGMVWAIPFPHLEFLGRYNGFVNWASFLIAIVIYYYYRISPLLSYGILLIVFAFSAAIVGLEKLNKYHNWPSLAIVCFIIFTVGLLVRFVGYRKEAKIPAPSHQISSLLNGPLWLMYKVFLKAGVKA